MPTATITKNSIFVILFTIVLSGASGCASSDRKPGLENGMDRASKQSSYGAPEAVGRLKNPNISESSGLAASRCTEDVFWTHNDSGDANLIFAHDSKGEDLGTFIVRGSVNKDWEDIASFKDRTGECFLFIGDIGNNGLKRAEMTVYRIPEPEIAEKSGGADIPVSTAEAVPIRFTYGADRFDAESLMVHPVDGTIYIATKQLSGPSSIFRLKSEDAGKGPRLAEKVAEVEVPAMPAGLFTGGDISPDGTRVVLCDYFSGYELRLPGSERDFDAIWKQTPVKVDLGGRSQGESVAYSRDGRGLFAGSEKKGSPLMRVWLEGSRSGAAEVR